MTVHVSPTRLAMLHGQFSAILRKRKDYCGPIFKEVNIREICHCLEELRRRRGEIDRQTQWRPSDLTLQLQAMAVGDTITLPPTHLSKITNARTCARRRLGVPDARWSSQTQDDKTVRIERLPDGAQNIHGKPKSPVPAILAAMNLHGRLTIDYSGRRIPSQMKTQARILLGGTDADWRFTNLANGKTKVVRTR